MANVATRLLSMLLLMQSRKTWKAGDLAQELGVSERTVHRYIGMLEELGIPIYSERGPYGGFSLLRGYRLPPLIFTAEEATVLYMGVNVMQEVWGRVYQDAVTSVKAKLDNVLPDDLKAQVDAAQDTLVVSGLKARDYSDWEPTINLLRVCVTQHCRVRISYRGFNLIETTRDVDPYALTFRSGFWYIIAYCTMRQDMRTFRIDRILEVVPLEHVFEIPDSFSARAYIEKSMQFEEKHKIEVLFSASIAPLIRERLEHWADLASLENGDVLVRFGAGDLEWPAGWVLSYGTAAKVLGPPELIAQIKHKLVDIAALYGAQSADSLNE